MQMQRLRRWLGSAPLITRAAPPRPDQASADMRVMACIAGADPLVTLSKSLDGCLAGIADLAPDRFANRRVLHLVSLTWHNENAAYRKRIADAVAAAAARLPGNRFVLVANTEFEAFLWSRDGIAALFAPELAFVDDGAFDIVGEGGEPVFDAVYNARFAPHKRHELASKVESLALLYGWLPGEEQRYRDVRALLPQAHFIQHEAGGGSYRRLTRDEVCLAMGRSRVGLCLSPEEGSMRASIEYQLCGLAVVSTRSKGGRDRYLLGPHCAIVDDDPDAVAGAVRRLAEARFDRQHIRNSVLRLIRFDRHNFMLALDKLLALTFGAERAVADFAPFAGYMRYRSVRDVLAGDGSGGRPA